jgi:hypothetical protein
MSTLLVEAVARTGEGPSEVLRDIALLRRLGADVNAPAPDGRYPLDAAARPEALAALLDSGARTYSDQVSVQLRRLVDTDDLATLGRLLALGVDPDLVRQSLLVSPRCIGPPLGTWRRLMHCWPLVPDSSGPRPHRAGPHLHNGRNTAVLASRGTNSGTSACGGHAAEQQP